MILSFLKIKNDVLQSNTSLFVEKVQKNFSEKIPQNHFYCIFKKEFFKKFQIFEIFRKPRAFGARNTTFGGLRPPKVGGPPHPRGKKFGGRHTEIAELKPSTVVIPIILIKS